MKSALKTLAVLLVITLMVSDAFAIFGVRRRTRRRTAVIVGATAAAETAAATSASQQQAAAAEAEAATAKKQAASATAGSVLPLGTVLAALPSGCTQKAIGGVTYYLGGGNYYRAVFQGTSLVYVTVAKPG